MRRECRELSSSCYDEPEVVVVPSSRSPHGSQRLRRHLAAQARSPTTRRPSTVSTSTAARKRRCCVCCWPRSCTFVLLLTLLVLTCLFVCFGFWSMRARPALPSAQMPRLTLRSGDAIDLAGLPDVPPAKLQRLTTNHVPLLVPLIGFELEEKKGLDLLRDMLQPLLESEVALCHRAADGAAAPATVHAVVLTRLPAKVVQKAVAATLESSWSKAGRTLADGSEKVGALTPGSAWRAWELSVPMVRAVLRLPNASHANLDGAVVPACFHETLTVVAHAVNERGSIFVNEPAEMLEVMVDAGLRTRHGAMGTHFIVLPSFLGGSRMPFTEPGDPVGVRYDGTGLVDALLRTATTHNGGRVAAAQCTILGATPEASVFIPLFPHHRVPPSLSMDDLRKLQVLDKGAFVGSTHHYMMLMPYLSRRLSQHRATDQRVSWEEVVDAVSLHCGIFHRDIYNAVGGLAGALALPGMDHFVSLLPDHLLAAPDRGGWALSLRMQELYPDWQVWSSRGVAVLRDTHAAVSANLRGGSSVLEHLSQTFYAIRDPYGQRLHPLLSGLQRRRVGQPWRTRGTSLRMWNSTAVPHHFPAVVVYSTDFDEPCCGLNREAMGYIRPLVERYAIRTRTATRVCAKPGDAIFDAAYHTRSFKRILSRLVASQTMDQYWRDAQQQRAHLTFLHMRPTSFAKAHSTEQRGVLSLTVSRSLSELSNIASSWVRPLRKETDQVWATADFFASIYRRNKVDAENIKIVPEAVDVYDYDPANYVRKPITVVPDDPESFDSQPELTPEERVKRYVFFSNFKWEDRKGWDILLGAYWDAFGPSAPAELRNRTTLVIKTKFEGAFAHGVNMENIVAFIEKWGKLGSLRGLASIHDMPHIIVLSSTMTSTEVTQLYASSDAFVFPSKAEGWGLPATEAMSMALPTLITEWSGLRRFITPDTCFRIPLDGLEEIDPASPYGYAQGMKMALPSRDKTAELMQYVVQHPEHARRVGQRARALIVREMSEEAVADLIDTLLLEAFAQRSQYLKSSAILF